MEYPIAITMLNDFIFCPISIYFHKIYGDQDKLMYQSEKQINGTFIHKSIDNNFYSSSNDVIQGLDVFSEKYGIVGKIDIYNKKTKTLIERKKHIHKLYDGYIFQVYAQYFSLLELGYEVNYINLYSYDNNKKYNILLPYNNKNMLDRFEETILKIRTFNPNNFFQNNCLKCQMCIYSDICDRSLL